MVKIKYVGRKATAIDNVAGSGKIWAGAGDVQEVTAQQARKLVLYADQWALENEKDLKLIAKEPVTRFINPDGDRVEIKESALNRALEKLSHDELRAFALENFQKSFRPDATRTSMMNDIEELQAGMDPFSQIQ